MKEVDKNNFEVEVLKSDIPVVVDFWAPWCAPCKKLAPLLKEVIGRCSGKVKFVKINIEQAPNLASSYMVMSIPTLIIFKNGSPCEKKTGLMSKRDLEKFIFSHMQ